MRLAAGGLLAASSAVALTGAGVSVPSGIPDFRTPETGLWAKVDPMEVAHIDVFERDPERFWSYYRPRFQSLGDKEPNRAHEALAELERRGLIEGVITQNIDRLHRAAGSENVIEVHGSIETSSCIDLRGTSFELEEVDGLFDERGVAVCSACGGAVKPDVVLFGELLPESAMARATELAERADLMLCVGSSLAVHPVAGLPRLTLERGGRLAIVTKGATPYDARRRAEARGRGRRGARRAAGGAELMVASPAAVVFDNDGLLLDTESVWTRAEEDLFERRGPEFTPADKRELVGTSAEIAGGILERRLGEPGRAAELIEELNVLVVAELEHGVEAMVGARELLERLRERGTPTRARLQLAAALRPALDRDRRPRGPLRRHPQRPRSGGAEAGPRSLPGGLPAPRGRAGAVRGRAGGLADRRGGGARRGPDRDRRPLDRGGRAGRGAPPRRVAAGRGGHASPRILKSNPQVEG